MGYALPIGPEIASVSTVTDFIPAMKYLRFITFIIANLATSSAALADDVLFVKNNFKYRLYIRVNGEWQGYVDPGRVAYMPQEGFVTEDSGFQADGTLKVTHSYGGWPISNTFRIEAVSAVFKNGDDTGIFYSEGEEPYKRGYKQWGFGDGSQVQVLWPSDVETESAEKMQRGLPPKEVQDLMAAGTSNVTVTGGKTVTGAVGGGKSFVLKRSGGGGAGETFTNSIGMKMIRVPGDTYLLAATETTQAQWRAVMGNSPSHFRGDSLPVEQVSWDDCMDFCRRLTDRERQAGTLPQGFIYTLPTETQWEKACRAGTQGDYAGPLNEMAWYKDNSGGTTHAVGTKRANAWGFFDMHGNVWEWCENRYEDGRAYRGGGWIHYAENCRSGYRLWTTPDYRYNTLGFRPALVPSR